MEGWSVRPSVRARSTRMMERIILAEGGKFDPSARLDEARPLFLLRPSPIATPLEVEMPSASLVSGLWPQLAPIILLACSNVFMTIAWYGHLKFKSVPLVTVVLVSWAIAFVEYCFAVPANRIGSAIYSPAELKTCPGGHYLHRVRRV